MMGIEKRPQSRSIGKVDRAFRTSLVACACWILAGGLLAQDASSTSLMDEGYARFAEGDLAAALDLFGQAFAQSPSDDQIREFVERLSAAKVFELVRSGDEKLAGVGVEILRRSTAAHIARSDDAEAIRAAVQEVLESEGDERLARRIRATHRFGRNLVPALVPHLSDPEIGVRAVVMNWIAEIGLDAVPPLAAATKHPDGRVRTNVAALLGARSLRHSYSLGFLQALAEGDPLEEVRDRAKRSVAEILSDLNGAAEDGLAAKQYFLRTAYELYKHPFRNVFDSRQYSPVIYGLEGDEVAGTKVARFQVGELMAKQCLTEALALDPRFEDARVLNVANDVQQLIEYGEYSAWYARQDGYDEEKAILVEQAPYVELVLRNRVLSTPPSVLYAAIREAAKDERAEVVTALIRVAHTVGLRGEAPPVLVSALKDGSSRLVRIAAAITIAYANPQSSFDAGSELVDTLAGAIVQSGIRTVVKGMGNQRLANFFDAMFRTRLSMESHRHERNVEALLHSARTLPPDLVLLDEELGYARVDQARAPVAAVITEFRKDYRTAEVPVVVVVDPLRLDRAKETYESEERKAFVVPANIDPKVFRETVLDPLFSAKQDGKALAARLSAEAAEALEYLTSVPTSIPVEKSVDALGSVLLDRPDRVRIACLGALGNMRATSKVGQVAQVFADTGNAHAVRVAAMTALGKIGSAMPSGVPSDILATIREGAMDTDLAIRRASWIAFGLAGASPQEHLDLIRTSVPEGAAAGAGAPDGSTPDGEGSGDSSGSDADDGGLLGSGDGGF